jgi:uracil-DNA glycosylase
MSFGERQLAMLREMGLRQWVAPAAAPNPSPALAPAPAPLERAVQSAPPPPAALRVEEPSAPAFTSAPAVDASAARARIGQLDWPALRQAVAGCRACVLCTSRKQTVFGVGHPRARWMVVGEAPGQQEDEQGEPFVGPAGQLLDNMLRALSLSRAAEGNDGEDGSARVFIANTLKCRPPGNRNPQPDELAACEPFLLRQIELVRPQIILAMGRFAVQSLLRSSEPIGKLRGQVHRYGGVPLVVTYHPAYLLRNLPDKAKAWEDLCLAAEVAEGRALA